MQELFRPYYEKDLEIFNEAISQLNLSSTLWYFSSGTDYMPITYFTFPEHLLKMNAVNAPRIDTFIYNNLLIGNTSLIDQLRKSEGKYVLFEDDRTRIIAEDVIFCSPVTNPEISGLYFDFVEGYNERYNKIPRPFVALIKLRLDSIVYDTRYCWLWCFEIENFYFLNQIILKSKISPTIICGKREGFAWGGARKSMNKYLQVEVIGKSTFTPEYYLMDSIKPGNRTIIKKNRYTMTSLATLNWESKGYEFVDLYKLDYH